MSSSAAPESPAESVAGYFNGAVISSAICAADELGLLHLLRETGPMAPDRIAWLLGAHPTALDALLRALCAARVLEERDGLVDAGECFGQVWQDKGYFSWLLCGYGRFLSHAGDLSRIGYHAADVRRQRDPAAIAQAGQDYGTTYVDDVFYRLLRTVDFRRALDLGCGNGARLIQLARSYRACTFVGVEIDPTVARTAAEAVGVAGVADTVELRCADARNLPADGALADVDLVFSFFMGHDFWPRGAAVQVLTALAEALPNARRLLLSDTCGRRAAPGTSWPIFSMGFDYTHGLMRQYLPTLEEWQAVFAETPWGLADVHPLGIPDSYVFDLVR